MKFLAVTLAFFCGITFIIANVLDVFLSKNQKKQVSDKLEEIWLKLDNAGFQIVVRGPLYLLEAGYNFIFGTNYFLKKGCIRAVGLGIFLIVLILTVDGIKASIPFACKQCPWEMIGTNVIVADPLNPNPNVQDDNQKRSTQQLVALLESIKSKTTVERLVKVAQWIVGHDSAIAKIIFTICVIPIVLLIGSLVYYLSLILSRILLEQAIKWPNVTSLFGVCILSILCIPVFYMIMYVTIMPIYYPQYMPIIFMEIILLVKMPLIAFSIVLPLLSIFALLAKPAWLGDMVIVVISPLIVLSGFIGIGLVLSPFHKYLYKMANTFILRALEHDKGVMYVVGCMTSAIITLIGLITQLFPTK